MVDWHNIAQQASNGWEYFMNWFLSNPIEIQVLVIIGAVAAIILAAVLVYYILKGVAYLIYYIFKGIYLLLKAIFMGLYKLFEELYYAISGKPKPVKQVDEAEEKVPVYEEPIIEQSIEESPVQRQYQTIPKNALYCSDCGGKFTETMHEQILKNGIAFCVNCGKGYRLQEMEVAQS